VTARPVALVTGASSGIGHELARVLAREGHDLVLVARRETQLRALAAELVDAHGAHSTVLAVDLAAPSGAARVGAEVEAAGLEVDVLVNNAGFGVLGPFSETDGAAELALLAVNVVALTELTKTFLPGMVERRRGRVLNVASTAAWSPGPGMAVYHASKAYVLSFSEALAAELRGTGVTSTALCPGVVLTGWQAAAGVSADEPILRSPGVTTAAFVAEAGFAAMLRGDAVVVPGLLNQIAVRARHQPPLRALLWGIERVHRLRVS
jgi:uncharacterized protein